MDSGWNNYWRIVNLTRGLYNKSILLYSLWQKSEKVFFWEVLIFITCNKIHIFILSNQAALHKTIFGNVRQGLLKGRKLGEGYFFISYRYKKSWWEKILNMYNTLFCNVLWVLFKKVFKISSIILSFSYIS